MDADRAGSADSSDWVDRARRMLPGQDIAIVTSRPLATGWTSVLELQQPARWPRIARAYARGIGSAVDVVGASCAAQGLAGRVLGPLIAVWATGRPVPLPGPEDVWVRLRRGRTIAVAYREAVPARAAVDDVVVAAVALIAPVIGAIRSVSPVTERVLWGNVGAACSGALGAAYRATEDRARTLAAADELIAAGWPGSLAVDCEAWDAPSGSGRSGPALVHRRATCCLIHLAPDHGFCPGCSRLDENGHRERWSARLAETSR